MLEHIENMRSKPEHIRRRYAFVISFSFSMIILAGWILSYGMKSSPVLTDSKDGKSKVDAPISSLTASAIGAFEDIKSIFIGSNKVDYSSQIEVVGGRR